MKNFKLIILSMVFLIISACNETESIVGQTDVSVNQLENYNFEGLVWDDFVQRIVGEENAELLRMFNDVSDFEREISIVDNPNFGTFSSSPQYDIFIGGKSAPDVSVSFDGNTYNANPSNGTFLKQGVEFKDYYGKNVNVEVVQAGSTLHNNTIYIPEALLCSKLGSQNSQNISRTGNTISWNSDANNTAGKILIEYSLFDNDEVGSAVGQLERDFLIVDDNGSYNIDHLFSDAQIRRVVIRFIRGNGFSIPINNEKTLITVRSVDHHEYIVE